MITSDGWMDGVAAKLSIRVVLILRPGQCALS